MGYLVFAKKLLEVQSSVRVRCVKIQWKDYVSEKSWDPILTIIDERKLATIIVVLQSTSDNHRQSHRDKQYCNDNHCCDFKQKFIMCHCVQILVVVGRLFPLCTSVDLGVQIENVDLSIFSTILPLVVRNVTQGIYMYYHTQREERASNVTESGPMHEK